MKAVKSTRAQWWSSVRARLPNSMRSSIGLICVCRAETDPRVAHDHVPQVTHRDANGGRSGGCDGAAGVGFGGPVSRSDSSDSDQSDAGSGGGGGEPPLDSGRAAGRATGRATGRARGRPVARASGRPLDAAYSCQNSPSSESNSESSSESPPGARPPAESPRAAAESAASGGAWGRAWGRVWGRVRAGRLRRRGRGFDSRLRKKNMMKKIKIQMR